MKTLHTEHYTHLALGEPFQQHLHGHRVALAAGDDERCLARDGQHVYVRVVSTQEADHAVIIETCRPVHGCPTGKILGPVRYEPPMLQGHMLH